MQFAAERNVVEFVRDFARDLIIIFISRCSQEPIPDERGREVGVVVVLERSHFSRGFSFPFPLWERLLSLPLLLPLAGVVFPAGRTSASPRGVAFRPRRRETKFCRWQRWAQRQRKPPPLRVSRTRVRRVHGEDHEDQEEEVHRCGPNVRQLGTERRVRKEPGVHVRELLLRCVVVIAVVVARRYSSFFLSRFSLSFTYHRG